MARRASCCGHFHKLPPNNNNNSSDDYKQQENKRSAERCAGVDGQHDAFCSFLSVPMWNGDGRRIVQVLHHRREEHTEMMGRESCVRAAQGPYAF